MPNLAVIEELKKHKNVEILYIGSKRGPERAMVEKTGVEFKSIACGKFRRYFSFNNFLDGFRIPIGILQAGQILKKFNPDVVFSKGGYVSFPVAIMAGFLKIPLICHESDVHPGIANRYCVRFAKKICISFEMSRSFFKKYAKKVVLTGNPIRILEGDKNRGFRFSKLDDRKPILLIMGGSQGALQINDLLTESLDKLLKEFQIVHIRGRGNLDLSLHRKGYVQYEYVDKEIGDIYAMSDIVVSRGGANSLAELAMLKKKAVIVPLGSHASRGDQVDNARNFVEDYGWQVLTGDINAGDFIRAINEAFHGKSPTATFHDGTKKIVKLILES